MKKVASIAVSFFMLAVLLASCGGQASSVVSSQIESGASASSSMAQSQLTTPAQRTVFRIAGLKGPTTMGMVKLMNDAEGESLYAVTSPESKTPIWLVKEPEDKIVSPLAYCLGPAGK